MQPDWTTWSLPGPPRLRCSLREVAALLDVSVKTLDRMIAAGRFPAGGRASQRSGPTWSGLDLACWLHLAPRLALPPEPAGAGVLPSAAGAAVSSEPSPDTAGR